MGFNPLNTCNVQLLIPGSQHSGTFEDDFNNSNDQLDTSQNGVDNNSENSQQRNFDDDDDVDGIDCRCPVCERQCSDIDL